MNSENNIIIAEFIGFDILSNGHFNYQGEITTTLPEFSMDWNWLMEVVIKINATTDYTLVIQAMDCYVYNVNSGKHITHPSGNWQPDELIKSVYEVVVEFIKWYNEQNS